MVLNRQSDFLPCVEAALTPSVLGVASITPPFSYIGMGMLPEAFTEYVLKYDFGSIPPDYIVLHHTVNPDASWAGGTNTATWWDRDEQGMGAVQRYNKRNNQLNSIRNYYRDTLHWSTGPHLFIDDTWIWLFTPMADIGTHAKQGNSYTVAGKLHYSVGIEVIGNYTSRTWPPKVAALVTHAVAMLKARLKNFNYIARPWAGGISSHRDYNKPECPGNQITSAYYINVLSKPAPAPPVDEFSAWGQIDRPEGEARKFAIPQAWLKNKATLGACLRGERYDVPGKVSRALFSGGEIRYISVLNIAEVLPYPQGVKL